LLSPLNKVLVQMNLPLKSLCQDIEKSLIEVGCTQAAYFGSVATKKIDQYSDIDLIICADKKMAEKFIHHLDQYKPIALYLPFESREPAGRYWFTGLPLYLKLDFSFHDSEEYQILLIKGNTIITGRLKRINL